MDFKELLPYVLASTPGCSEPMATQHILRAAVRFCGETKLLKTPHAAIPMVADQAEYTLTVPAGRRILQIDDRMKLVDGGGIIRYLTQATEQKLDLAEPTDYGEGRLFRYSLTKIPNFNPGGWRTIADTFPTHYYQPSSAVVRMFPIPEQADNEIYPILILIPSLDATEVDGSILEDYFDTISLGAIATLLRVPKQKWTDRVGAREKEGEFGDAIIAARRHERSSRARGDHTVSRVTAYS